MMSRHQRTRLLSLRCTPRCRTTIRSTVTAVLTLLLLVGSAGCGEKPVRIGVLLNDAGLTKSKIGDSPPDLPSRGLNLTHRDAVTGRHAEWRRVKEADVIGDERTELLVELPDGGGISVVDEQGSHPFRLSTDHYLTDFGSIVASRAPKKDIVFYLYPNAERGATFRVTTPDGSEVASWKEERPTSHFDSGIWKGTPALFYLSGDNLTVRSATGQLLTTLPAPGGQKFREVTVRELFNGYSVLLASGSGYTAFNMVCVYDPDTKLAFQEVAEEHAFALDTVADRLEFTVWTRSTGWRYRGS